MNNIAKPAALITGASAGIGEELAREFARNGHGVVLVARRHDKLNALADSIAATGAARPHVIALDLLADNAVNTLRDALAAKGIAPGYIVNNAGFGLSGFAADSDIARQLDMIDLNVRALTELSLAFIEQLARQRGGILNVASVAGFLPGPGMAVYYATKAYVLSFSEALSSELRGRGITVTALCPGPVPTEFQAVSGMRHMPGPLTISADVVARAGYRGLMAGKRVVVPGVLTKVLTFLPRLLPRGAMLALIDRAQNARRRRSS